MKETGFIESAVMQKILMMDICFPATIISFDEALDEAKIQPLLQRKTVGHDPQSLKPIEGVPVIKQRFKVAPTKDGVWGTEMYYKPLYKAGDVVLCVCGQRSLDGMMSGTPYPAGGARIFNAADAVIVGVVKFA